MPSGNIFKLYVNCLMGFIARKGGETDISRSSSQDANYISRLLSVYERAETMKCLTEDLACDYVSFYLQLGELDKARKLSEKLCLGKLADSAKLWELRIKIEIKCTAKRSNSSTDNDQLSLFELLRYCLTKFPVSKSENLWIMVCFQLRFLISNLPIDYGPILVRPFICILGSNSEAYVSSIFKSYFKLHSSPNRFVKIYFFMY